MSPAASSSSASHSKGVLLINLGTPDGAPSVGPSTEQVKNYLKQFLMDPFVVDIPAFFRWMLVTWILRRRPEQSAEAYRKIWMKEGSPLLHYHLALTKLVRERLSEKYGIAASGIEPAMRYGNPSIPNALKKLVSQGVKEIFLVPLYPQYSLAATESSIAECKNWIGTHAPHVKLSSLPAFYEDEAFIRPFVTVAKKSLEGDRFDHLLFSFHGLPERQIRKVDRSGGAHCLQKNDCCASIVDANRDCYRAQCFATARALAGGLGLSKDQYTVCFQSRLGRTPWIRPYTDIVYGELAASGVKKIAVMSPAFVADCLETLEELALRGKDQFVSLGGEDLKLIPSLNDSAEWAEALSDLIYRKGFA